MCSPWPEIQKQPLVLRVHEHMSAEGFAEALLGVNRQRKACARGTGHGTEGAFEGYERDEKATGGGRHVQKNLNVVRA